MWQIFRGSSRAGRRDGSRTCAVPLASSSRPSRRRDRRAAPARRPRTSSSASATATARTTGSRRTRPSRSVGQSPTHRHRGRDERRRSPARAASGRRRDRRRSRVGAASARASRRRATATRGCDPSTSPPARARRLAGDDVLGDGVERRARRRRAGGRARHLETATAPVRVTPTACRTTAGRRRDNVGSGVVAIVGGRGDDALTGGPATQTLVCGPAAIASRARAARHVSLRGARGRRCA